MKQSHLLIAVSLLTPIQQAVIDKETAPIYYESRIAKLSLNEAELPKVDAEFEEITAGEEEDRQQKLKTNWAALEAMDGKAIVVCLSRWICADLYHKLIKLRPDWAMAERINISPSLVRRTKQVCVYRTLPGYPIASFNSRTSLRRRATSARSSATSTRSSENMSVVTAGVKPADRGAERGSSARSDAGG